MGTDPGADRKAVESKYARLIVEYLLFEYIEIATLPKTLKDIPVVPDSFANRVH
jgi:hypothetical protein